MTIVKLATAVLLAISAGPVAAESGTSVPDDLRKPSAPLPLAVHLAQDTVLIGPDPSIGPTATAYGLVGALVVGALEAGQSKRARAEGAPLSQAIGSFDADVPLMAGIKAGAAGVPWLRLQPRASVRDGSIEAKNALLDAVGSPYLVDVDCGYNFGESFEAIYGRCTTRIADKRIVADAPGGRWKPGKLLFTRSVTVMVALDTSHASPPLPYCFGAQRRLVCRSKWMESSAALARAQLTVALETLGRLVVKSVSLSPAEADTAGRTAADRVFLVAPWPYHVGWTLEGHDNILQSGRKPGWGAAQQATLRPDSTGVTIIGEGGNLFHKRTVSVP